MKTNITVSVDHDVIEKIRKSGINVSALVNTLLKEKTSDETVSWESLAAKETAKENTRRTDLFNQMAHCEREIETMDTLLAREDRPPTDDEKKVLTETRNKLQARLDKLREDYNA